VNDGLSRLQCQTNRTAVLPVLSIVMDCPKTENIRIAPAYLSLGNTIRKSAILYVLFPIIILLNKERFNFYG